MRVRLDNLISKWLNNHKHLKKFYKVYRYKDWPPEERQWDTEWPDILDGVDAFIGMACNAVGVASAIMDDHVYHKNSSNGPKFKIMAGDPEFFDKLEKDLTEYFIERFTRTTIVIRSFNADVV